MKQLVIDHILEHGYTSLVVAIDNGEFGKMAYDIALVYLKDTDRRYDESTRDYYISFLTYHRNK